MYAFICWFKLFYPRSIESIDISPKNSGIVDQNLNPLNPSRIEADCFTELKAFCFKNPKNLKWIS